jgi:hypothetical protein
MNPRYTEGWSERAEKTHEYMSTRGSFTSSHGSGLRNSEAVVQQGIVSGNAVVTVLASTSHGQVRSICPKFAVLWTEDWTYVQRVDISRSICPKSAVLWTEDWGCVH